MLKIAARFACLPLLWALGQAAPAQEAIQVPGDSKFVLQVDLQALRASKVGSTLFKIAQEAALEEVGKNFSSNDPEMSMTKIREVLGFDPLEEVQGIVLCASDYESPEKSLVGMVRLKETTGNLEGLLLSLPGYDKSEHRKHDLYSASPDEHSKFYGAIHKSKQGNHTLIVGADRSAVTGLLDSLDQTLVDSSKLKSIALEPDRKVIANLEVLELPAEKLGKGPQANIANLLNSMRLSVVEEDDDLEVRGALQTTTEKQAEQIRQAIQGFSAMIELMASMDEMDPEMKDVLAFLKKVKTNVEGTSVKVMVHLSSHQVAELIEKEFK